MSPSDDVWRVADEFRVWPMQARGVQFIIAVSLASGGGRLVC